MKVYIYVHTYIRVYTRAHTYMYIYTCTHIHTERARGRVNKNEERVDKNVRNIHIQNIRMNCTI